MSHRYVVKMQRSVNYLLLQKDISGIIGFGVKHKSHNLQKAKMLWHTCDSKTSKSRLLQIV